MAWQFLLLSTIIFIGVVTSIVTGKLTAAGALIGGVMALVLYAGAGWVGLAFMAAFFVLGTTATSWRHRQKQYLKITGENHDKRTASQVLANGGVGALLGLLAWLFPQQHALFLMMIAASFSSATADTLSSELGSVYGKKFYNILSFKKDKRGLDGVISMEGTLIGVAGSMAIALIYGWASGWSKNVFWVVLAGTLGNLADSFLGAAWERRGLLHNDMVNFLNTLVAALVCLLAYF